MRDQVLLLAGHLRVRLALVLEARIPAYECSPSVRQLRGQDESENLPKSIGPLASTILP